MTEWLSQRPPELIQFICSLCDFDLNTSKESKLSVVAKIVELIYYSKNSKLVLPNHFMENVYAYSLTNCKTFCNYFGTRSPGGSYHYMSSWLNMQNNESIPFPEGLVKAIFDNNQKIGKTHMITGDNKVPTVVMTSQLWITLDPQSKLQEDANLKPESWMWKEVDNNIVLERLTRKSNEFRESRNSFIRQCIGTLVNQIGSDGKDFIDSMLASVKLSKSEKLCPQCGCESDTLFRVCRNVINETECATKLVHSYPDEQNELPKTSIDPYGSFKFAETFNPETIFTIGEPEFVNPNSFESIISVIQSIGLQAGVKQYGGDREWLFIECDGLPYGIIRDIIRHVWRCDLCKSCFYKIESFHDHRCYIIDKAIPKREFSWLIPISGLLHFEMNGARAFLKRNVAVFIRAMGNQLGFKSPKAQEYLLKGSDHHKTWQLLEMLYSAVGLELLHPYVMQACKSKSNPTVSGYWNWCKNISDPNYVYMQHMIMTYLHSLMMLRSGVRKCNFSLIEDSKTKIAELFFSGNHPIYQKILVSDTLDTLLMPNELREVKKKYVSHSRTGHSGKFQGGDACLEEVNKESKSWLKLSGIPSEERWLRIFRNLDSLNKVGVIVTIYISDSSFFFYQKHNILLHNIHFLSYAYK